MIFYHHTDPSYLPSIFEKGLLARPWHAGEEGMKAAFLSAILHCVGMSHGLNGFRCWNGLLPIDYRQFERCQCGWIDLPHYIRCGVGPGKCVSPEQILRNGGLTAKEARAALKSGAAL